MKDDDRTFHVETGHAQQTLAAALRHWLPGHSWNQARDLIERRRILVNGNLCTDAARRLKAGDVVRLLGQPHGKPPQADGLRIRHLDPHIVVVEKPAEVTTLRHPEERFWDDRRKQHQPTLDEMLNRAVAREERLTQTPRARTRPGGLLPRVRAVHRLDRDTSGLMVFARTVDAERHLGRQFKLHTIHRVYLALVVGAITEPRTFTSFLVRDRGDGRRGSTTLAQHGKRAVTHVKPVEIANGYTLLECRLETGRTHQIRIHLAEAGHPLCGEKVYQKQLDRAPVADRSGAPRIALHAAELGFIHPVNDANLVFKSSMPADLRTLWDRLKKG